jgi:N-acetyl-gamma-glutamyl-phosphate reductase
MEKYNIFIAGKHGSVGMKLEELLQKHQYTKIINKTQTSKKKSKYYTEEDIKSYLKQGDLMFLALPEEASQQILAIQKQVQSKIKIIDCSVLNRTNKKWVYGLPELSLKQKSKIQEAQLVANPGCHATGAILAIKSVIESKILNNKSSISIFSTTGYSGGGKKLCKTYQQNPHIPPKSYSSNKKHKHEDEIEVFTGINDISFNVHLSPIEVGMKVINNFSKIKGLKESEIIKTINDYFKDSKFVDVKKAPESIDMTENNNTNKITLYIYYDIIKNNLKVTSVLDNLIKGSAGVAIQNMNLMLGLHETEGII